MRKVASAIRHGAPPVKEIVGDDAIREQRCLAEVQLVLQRFDCVMVPEIMIGGGQIQERVRFRAIPRGGPAVVAQ